MQQPRQSNISKGGHYAKRNNQSFISLFVGGIVPSKMFIALYISSANMSGKRGDLPNR